MSERLMSDDFHNFRAAIERQFEAIQGKLDRLDEAIRGTPSNGSKPSILIRLDRLEQDARRQGKLLWLIVGAAITALASGVVIWLSGLPGGGGA